MPAVVLPAASPAHAGIGGSAQGIQLGQVIDVHSCARQDTLTDFLDNPEQLAATQWLRIDLRAAGGNNSTETLCDVGAAYQSILNDLASRAPHIKIIGLLSIDFIYGGGNNVDITQYATAAGTVACSSQYQRVGVWEIWNEPDLNGPDAAYQPPDRYAHLLGQASVQIRGACGNDDRVISGGVTPGTLVYGPVHYLNDVSAQFAADPIGTGYTNLQDAVDGIGVHPYVDPVPTGTAGQTPLNDFLYEVWSNFGKSLYLTEFGWRIKGTDQYGVAIDEANQCHNLVNGFRLIADGWTGGERVVAATWFTMRDFGVSIRNYGLYTQTGVIRPAQAGYTRGDCPPPKPAAPTVTASGGTAVTVAWAAVAGATSYLVSDGTTTHETTATSYLWTGLTPGTQKCVTLATRNGFGDSWPTDQVCGQTVALPAAPSGVTATAVSSTSIRVDWTDNSTDEDYFWFSNGVTSFNLPPNTRTYTWTGLAPGTYMCTYIRAHNAAGLSPYSNQGCITTPPLPPTPGSPAAVAYNGTTIQVTWTDPASNETGFEVESSGTIVPVAANTTSYLWGGLGNGVNRCFRVRTVRGADVSGWTGSVCATTPTIPAPVTYVTATPYNGTTITVGWTDNSNNETGFQIESNSTIIYVGANVTSYQWGGLANGTYRCFRIRSWNVAGNSAWSPNVCATTPTIPAPVTYVSATPYNGTTITVGWVDNSNNETGFQIESNSTIIYVGANVTSYQWGGLANGTYRCFRIRSWNVAGNSAWSPYVCATTPTIPAAPSNTVAVPLNTSQIRVTWSDNSSNETNFQVEAGSILFTLGANTTTFTRTGLGSRQQVCFRVRTFNTAGYSAWSNYSCATTY